MSYLSEPESSELNRDALGYIREAASKVCPTRLIEDTPADEDRLSFHEGIGPHERVAQAIAEVIRSPDESGGKMIGLEGGWGAGKTTVIKLLRKQLGSNNDITVFCFDAWAHEGDPLRRTYLESLIRHFQFIHWIDKTEWDKTLEKLANRRRVTSTRTVPKTTTLGKLLAISALLVPLGISFLMTSLPQGITIDHARLISWMFIIGILFTAAPFLVLVGNLIRVGWKRLRKKKNGGESSDKLKDDDQSISDWAFLTGNAITETKQDTTETPEPTSIEFEDEFRKLMQTALPETTSRQAVMVLDNLDRVDPKDALSIWATLQTFLQDRSTKTEQWFNKLWIIVPHDPSGLRQLWANRGAVDKAPSEENAVPADGQNDAEQAVSVSFIDKSFQLRFEVPPPVLSNWKAYLTKLVAEALPEHSEDDRDTIYRVFNMCRAKDGGAPTPRELKLYVNQIGAIHRQWQHEFPIGHVAYYVILRRKHANIRKGLLSRTFPDPNIESILPSNLGANLAGLAFNVRASLGQQLLLGDPINDALAKNNVEGLQKLEKRHQDGFWVVLEDVATSQLADADATTVANAALCLDQSGIFKDQKRSETRTVIAGLARATSSVTSWSPFNESLANGIATACRLVSGLDVSKKVVATLRQTIREPAKKEKTLAVTEGVIAGLVNICEQIDGLGHQDAFGSPFTLPGDAQGWVEVCSRIKTQKQKWWSLFKPQAKFEEISQLLCTAITNGQFSDGNLAAVQVTQESSMICNWDTLATALEQRLNASQNPNSKEANLLLNGLSLLRRYNCANAQAASKRLADGGHLMHSLHQAQSQNDVEGKVWCIVTFLEEQPGAAKSQIVGNSEAGYNILTNLLNTDDVDLAWRMVTILRDQNNLSLLFTVVDERDQYDLLVIRCLRIVADNEKSEILYTPAAVIKRWSALREHLDKDESDDRFDKLISHLCEKSSLVEEVQKAEGEFNHEDAGLYLAICEASSSESFREWCRVGLETLDASQWKSELDNEGGALELMLTLMNAGMSVDLKQPYQDAIVGHAEGVLDGSVTPSDDLVSRRSRILAGLGTEAARTILRRRLRDVAMDRNGKCANGFFEMYGEEIADNATLTGDKSIIAKLFSPLLRQRNIGSLRWLSSVFSDNPNILDKSTDMDSVQDFRERLQGELGKPAEEGDEVRKLIAEIANTLGIEPEEEPLENEAASEGDTPEDEGIEERNSNEQ